ncbi:ImuA family protein [Paracoccus sp. C2R09]|uniref:ImuA family protein n=2 Tax=unclassified Paracoccus (in: a-proteobacteria) TaxID=2688777 RepID=UPI0020911A03|nr:ImuA family protein [Paracoccus sp. C2R09]
MAWISPSTNGVEAIDSAFKKEQTKNTPQRVHHSQEPDTAMSSPLSDPTLALLRHRVAAIEGDHGRPEAVLPFGLTELDRRLPKGGLAVGCLHEVAGGGNGAVDGAAASCFAAGIAARLPGQVLWCVTQADLFAPGLEQAGLSPDRVIHVEAGDDISVLACMEEGLRHGGLAAVVADVSRLSMTASRRLHLAAKASGTTGIALRRWRRQAEASDFGQPTAAMTRWRVSVLPSVPLPVQGVGRSRWLVELLRARAGESFDIELEACDGTGHLGLSADVAGGSAASAGKRAFG